MEKTKFSHYEKEFNLTIHRTLSVEEQAQMGEAYDYDEKWAEIAMSKEYKEPVNLDVWKLPPGAFGESNGPT